MEWEAWLRGRRDDVPTAQEMEASRLREARLHDESAERSATAEEESEKAADEKRFAQVPFPRVSSPPGCLLALIASAIRHLVWQSCRR